MNVILHLLAALVGVASLVCWIVILIDAFQDAIWRGILGLLCWFYLLWYAVFDFEHENKWLIVIGAFGGTAIASGIATLAR